MDLFLDEAESAFLQAVLTGTDASPAFPVARAREVAAVQHYSQGVPSSQKGLSGPGEDAAVTVRPDGSAFPSPSDNQAPGKQPHCSNPHTQQPPCAPTPYELPVEQHWLQPQPGHQPQSQLQDTSGRVSKTLCTDSAACQSRQPQPQPQLQLQSQSQPPQPLQGQHPCQLSAQQHHNPHHHQQQQEAAAANGQVAITHIHHQDTTSVQPPVAAGQLVHYRLTEQLLSAAPTISPSTAGTARPHSEPIATGAPPPAPPARSSFRQAAPTLPSSNSTISTVSEASTATTSGTAITAATSARPHRRRRSSSTNLAGAGALGSSSGMSSGSSTSRRFSSATSIPASATDPEAADASAMVHGASTAVTMEAPAAAAGVAAAATAAASATPSCRRAHGLLQRIQSLEAQLTELLVADSEEEAPAEHVSRSSQDTGPGTEPKAGSPPCRPTAASRHCDNPPSRMHPPSQAHRLQPQSVAGRRSAASSSSSSSSGAGNLMPPADEVDTAAVAGADACVAPQCAAFRRRSSRVFVVVEQLCRDYNSSGVALMEAGLDEAAREQLEKALLLVGPGGPLEGRPDKQRELQIVAHNNLACYWRKLGKPALALQHLQHTARLESTAAAAMNATADTAGPEPSSAAGGCLVGEMHPDALHKQGTAGAAAAAEPGGGGDAADAAVPRGGGPQGNPTAATLLNLAACSSSLGQHMQALSYAARAVQAAAGELRIPQAALEAALLQGLPQVQLWEVLPQLRTACRGATMQLAMAYYNRAVEQEHLHQWQAALESYRLAVDVASRFVGRGNDLTLTMQQSAEAFKVRLRKLERQGKVRATGRVASQGASLCGVVATGTGTGSCPGLAPTLQASSTTGAGACTSGGGAPPRSHPQLRPLLRCSTAPKTTTAATSTAAAAAGTGYAAAAAVATAAATAAAAAAAQAMAGLPAKALSRTRTPGLPSIVPGRSASLSLISGTTAPPSQSAATAASAGGGAAGSVSPVAWTQVGATGSGASAPPHCPAALPPRRALSAGREWPPQRLSSVVLSSGLESPAPAPAWAVPQMRRGSTCHVTTATAAAAAPPPSRGSASHVPSEAATAAAPEPPLRRGGASAGSAVRAYADAAQLRRCTAWSPPLPPRPRPEVSGDAGGRAGAGDRGGGYSGGGAPEPGLHMEVGCRPGGPSVAVSGIARGGGGGGGGAVSAGVGPSGMSPPPPPLPPSLQPWCSSSLATATVVSEPGVNGARSASTSLASPQPPVPMPLAARVGTISVTAATTAKAQHAPASHAVGPEGARSSTATSLTVQRHSETEAEAEAAEGERFAAEGGTLAAVAAAAVAAAAELARICAANEDTGQGQGQGQGQEWRQVVVDAHVGHHQMYGSERSPSSVKKEPKRGSLAVRSSAQPSPAGVCGAVGRSDGVSDDVNGAADGGGGLARKGNGCPERPAVHSAACPGSMLVPKRDGVAV